MKTFLILASVLISLTSTANAMKFKNDTLDTVYFTTPGLRFSLNANEEQIVDLQNKLSKIRSNKTGHKKLVFTVSGGNSSTMCTIPVQEKYDLDELNDKGMVRIEHTINENNAQNIRCAVTIPSSLGELVFEQ